ncbi:hypothetical protein ACI3RH_09070 [Lactococcus lactis]
MIINFYTNEESCYGFENKTQMVFVRKNEVTSEGNQKMLWSIIGSGSLLSPFLTDFSLYLNHFSNEMNILLWLLLSITSENTAFFFTQKNKRLKYI